MSVAAVDAIVSPLAVAGVAEHVDVAVHEQLSCHLHHLSEQVGIQQGSRGTCAAARPRPCCCWRSPHLSFLFRCRFLKVDAVAVASGGCSAKLNAAAEAISSGCTPLWRTQLCKRSLRCLLGSAAARAFRRPLHQADPHPFGHRGHVWAWTSRAHRAERRPAERSRPSRSPSQQLACRLSHVGAHDHHHFEWHRP